MQFQYFLVVELSLNNQGFQPQFYTGIQSRYEVEEKIVFPIKYQDLGAVSMVGITIYDMKRPYDDSLVAGTCIDLFDEKLRLRQGTFNLFLHPRLKAELGL